MIRNNIFMRALIGALLVLLAAPFWVFAQSNGWAPAQSNESVQRFSRAELDQMLAPVALYPDSLLAQVFIAATYPSEVVEADRWVKENKGLGKDQLNAALDKKDWDLSVKALVPFPQVLAMMDEHLDWTTKLGEAFLAQQKEVMGEIQLMRQKAYAAGNLKSTDQQKVVVSGEDIEIEPANPEVVYVPYYDPWVIYGNWWWPDYPPFAWYPFGAPFITVGLFGWLPAVSVGPFWGWGWGYWNWGGGNCFVNVNRTININDPHLRMTRGHFRTEGFHQFAGRQGIGPGRTAGNFGAGRTFTGARPPAASVERGLSRGGFAHSGGFARGGFHGGNFARGGASSFGHASNFKGASHFGGGHVASGFGRGGFAHSGGFAGGGFHGGNFARGGASSFGHASNFGGASHFGGGHVAFGFGRGGFAHSGGFAGGGFHGGDFAGGGLHGGGFGGGGHVGGGRR